ncbi:MAG: type IV pilus biogenesis/stability protein PilW [Gammaproteobacteria bacterium]
MKKIVTILLPVVLLVSACTTQEYLAPVDAKRASRLNAELGLGYMREGQYERAKYKLDKAIKYNPENPHAYHYMAELYRRLKEYDKAGKYYRKAMALDPSDMDIQNNYGVYLCEIGKYDKAYKHFDKIIDNPIYPSRANTYENVGLCAARQGNLALAQKSFISALKLNPKMPKSLLQLAELDYDKGNVDKAYRYYERYIAIAPQTSESLWIGILLERSRGNTDTEASYKILLKGKFPDSDEAKRLRKLESMGKL